MTSKLFVKGVAITLALILGVVYMHTLIYPNKIHSVFSVMNSHKNNNPTSPSTIFQPIPSLSYYLTSNQNVTEAPRQHLPSSNITDEPLMLTPPVTTVPAEKKEESLNNSVGMRKSYSKLERLEARLRRARATIRGQGDEGNRSNAMQDPDYVPNGAIYWNPAAFHRSYLEMEKLFKVYIYEEGDPPIFHSAPPSGVLGMEGIFLNEIEVSHFRTRDPHQAHVYFLPISIVSIVHYVFIRESREWSAMKNTALDYVNLIAHKHPYWNRSLGADHVMLACHDWGPEISHAIPNLYNNSIRALCNANTTERFSPIRDVSIPEIYLPDGTTEGLLNAPSPSHRTTFVFFAGGIHGYIRQVLFEHWENKDNDIQIQQYLPRNGESYYNRLRKSKYCICPSGYEVADARIFEALYTGCVPVLIKAHYVAPFSDVLNWKLFSVDIPVEDIPKLKQILMGISDKQYIKMQQRGLKARRHFEVNFPPKRYDVFHMILHSIWLRRLNLHIRDNEEF